MQSATRITERIAAAKQKDQVQKLVGSEVEKQKAKLFLGAEDAFSDEATVPLDE